MVLKNKKNFKETVIQYTKEIRKYIFDSEIIRRYLYILKPERKHMNFSGIIIGVSAFLIIGVFHPIVIKTEYYFGKKVWPVFLFVGVILIGVSIGITDVTLSSITGIIGFSSLWSIHELIEQEQRVQKGWFPKNPNKK